MIFSLYDSVSSCAYAEKDYFTTAYPIAVYEEFVDDAVGYRTEKCIQTGSGTQMQQLLKMAKDTAIGRQLNCRGRRSTNNVFLAI